MVRENGNMGENRWSGSLASGWCGGEPLATVEKERERGLISFQDRILYEIRTCKTH